MGQNVVLNQQSIKNNEKNKDYKKTNGIIIPMEITNTNNNITNDKEVNELSKDNEKQRMRKCEGKLMDI